MRILILTFFGCLLFAAGYAQDAASAQKLQRAQENMTRREQRLEDAQAVREARAVRRAAAEAERMSKPDTQAIAQKPGLKITGAHLRMDHPTYNFGDVLRKGGDLIHDFAFTNDGSVPLVVTRVITSCSCLKATFPKRPVAPGETAAIRITYEPHKSEPGSFNKVIQVYSNSIDGRDVITVQGNSIESDQIVKIKGEKIKVK